jgi:1,4-dihydroxy-2-naphthoyl-CoA hydrolase
VAVVTGVVIPAVGAPQQLGIGPLALGRGLARLPRVEGAGEATGRDGLGELIGLEWIETTPEEVRARIPVTEHVVQPAGLVHGGVYSAVAESICSAATWLAVHNEGMAAMGQSNAATFLRPITQGHVNATAKPRHRGRTTWVWDVEITDDESRLCALVRMTVAIRPVAG